jgi:hypothetical protein
MSAPPLDQLVPLLHDFHARATRIGEAHDDGDHEFVSIAVDDLAEDLWKLVERLESVTP